MTIADVRAGLNQLVNRVERNETRISVATGGIPVAVVVSAADLVHRRWLDVIAPETEPKEDWDAHLPSDRRAGRPGEDS